MPGERHCLGRGKVHSNGPKVYIAIRRCVSACSAGPAVDCASPAWARTWLLPWHMRSVLPLLSHSLPPVPHATAMGVPPPGLGHARALAGHPPPGALPGWCGLGVWDMCEWSQTFVERIPRRLRLRGVRMWVLCIADVRIYKLRRRISDRKLSIVDSELSLVGRCGNGQDVVH